MSKYLILLTSSFFMMNCFGTSSMNIEFPKSRSIINSLEFLEDFLEDNDLTKLPDLCSANINLIEKTLFSNISHSYQDKISTLKVETVEKLISSVRANILKNTKSQKLYASCFYSLLRMDRSISELLEHVYISKSLNYNIESFTKNGDFVIFNNVDSLPSEVFKNGDIESLYNSIGLVKDNKVHIIDKQGRFLSLDFSYFNSDKIYRWRILRRKKNLDIKMVEKIISNMKKSKRYDYSFNNKTNDLYNFEILKFVFDKSDNFMSRKKLFFPFKYNKSFRSGLIELNGDFEVIKHSVNNNIIFQDYMNMAMDRKFSEWMNSLGYKFIKSVNNKHLLGRYPVSVSRINNRTQKFISLIKNNIKRNIEKDIRSYFQSQNTPISTGEIMNKIENIRKNDYLGFSSKDNELIFHQYFSSDI